MTYNTNVPNAAQSPGLFPAQANTNFDRLKTIFDANHQFNDTAATNDGYHVNMKLMPQAIPGNDATVGQLYVQNNVASNQLFWKDGTGLRTQITPTIPIRAYVFFTVNAGVATAIATFNSGGFVRDGVGLYTFSFSPVLPSDLYLTMCIAQPTATNRTRYCMLRGGADYTVAQTTGSVKIQIQNSDGDLEDPVSAQILVFGG